MPDKIKFHGTDLQSVTTSREKTPEGYLKATAAITGVGVQMYLDSELGGEKRELVGVFRGEDTVFHAETIASAKMKPITHQHPDINVDANNYKELSIGHIGDRVEALDEKRLGASVQITDTDVIKKIEAGLCETSAGYECYLIREDGEYEGQPYKYRFAGPMIINHLAIVEQGRCGPEVRILDRRTNNMTKEELLKLLRDALNEDQGATENKVDIDAIVSKMGDALLPKIEDLINASQNDAEDDADDEGDDQDDVAPLDVADAVKARTQLITDVAPLLDDEQDVHSMNDREILEVALADDIENIADQDDAYLRGVLDTILKDRKAASDKADEIKTNTSVSTLAKPMSGLDARKLKKQGE